MKLENPTMHSVSADALALEHFWMPFTANRAFKAAPRLLAKADGMYYWTPDGRQVLETLKNEDQFVRNNTLEEEINNIIEELNKVIDENESKK